jgi:hypothetical protein
MLRRKEGRHLRQTVQARRGHSGPVRRGLRALAVRRRARVRGARGHYV